MRKLKKNLVLLLTVVLSMCFNTTAFAAETATYSELETVSEENTQSLFEVVSVRAFGSSVGTGQNTGRGQITVEVRLTRDCPKGVLVRAGAVNGNSRFRVSVLDQANVYAINLCDYDDNIRTNGGKTDYFEMNYRMNAGHTLIFNFNIEDASAYTGCLAFAYEIV